jgi:hypothetical protein
MRQSEDYLYYSLNPGKISTDLMVGAVDGDGNRKPRNNCIFYVNQPDTPDTDPNYAKNRAIQLEALLNLENPGGDYVRGGGSFCGTIRYSRLLLDSSTTAYPL